MSDVHRSYAFAGFTLDLDRGALSRNGADVKLRPQSFEVLAYLVRHHGRLVSKDELIDAVWSDTVVTESSLTQCVMDVRKALGDDSHAMIRNVPRRGYLFDAPVIRQDGGDGVEAPGRAIDARQTGWRVVAGAALLVAVAAVWWVSREAPAPDEPIAVEVPPNSIAVLRFADMSAEQDQAYLADGLAEEILHVLAQIPELLVIARTSSFAVEGDDIAAAAAKLNVAHVLEGSVRKSGDRIRITAQLVDAATSAHRWSKTYDRELDDLLEVQTEIAGAVASALHVTLADDRAPANAPPRDPRAHERFLLGHFFYNRRAPGDIERAREHYEQALAIDPEYARAWVGLAAVYRLQLAEPGIALEIKEDEARRREVEERQREAVERALALAPDLPEAQRRAATYYFYTAQDRPRGIEHFERARALDPDHPLVLGGVAGSYIWANRLDEAIALWQRAVLRDPLGAVSRGNLAADLMAAGRLDEALAEFRKVLALGRALSSDVEGRVDRAVRGVGRVLLLQRRLDEALEWIEPWPAGQDRDQGLAMVYHALGRPVEADAALERLIASAGTSDPLQIAEAHAYRGDFDHALAWLERVRGPESCRNWLFLRVFHSPFLALMRGDPRWEAWRNDAERAMQECVYAR